ncbi:hypothetical protein ASF30_10200 [Leifsonia sp. Leaf264]|nr:hypothetical protein ASF30_10200 [Leifsonia sp. Leaf264]
MAHPGREITAGVPALKTVAVIASVFVNRGFTLRSPGTTDSAVLTFGSPIKQWFALMLPVELLPATRTWGHDITVHISTVEQSWEGCTVRVDASGAIGDRPFAMFSDTLSAAIAQVQLFGKVDVGELTDRTR